MPLATALADSEFRGFLHPDASVLSVNPDTHVPGVNRHTHVLGVNHLRLFLAQMATLAELLGKRRQQGSPLSEEEESTLRQARGPFLSIHYCDQNAVHRPSRT